MTTQCQHWNYLCRAAYREHSHWPLQHNWIPRTGAGVDSAECSQCGAVKQMWGLDPGPCTPKELANG